MLPLTIPAQEVWDEITEEFKIVRKSETLYLEHSLISISKWESKWHKPFSVGDRTYEETIDYIRCMSIKDIDPEILYFITDKNILEVNKYINDPMTATTFSNMEKESNRDVITSELIYFAMINNNIPFECQKWHINRLLTLIRICNIKNNPEKKMSQNEIFRQNRELNEQRKRLLNTRG